MNSRRDALRKRQPRSKRVDTIAWIVFEGPAGSLGMALHSHPEEKGLFTLDIDVGESSGVRHAHAAHALLCAVCLLSAGSGLHVHSPPRRGLVIQYGACLKQLRGMSDRYQG